MALLLAGCTKTVNHEAIVRQIEEHYSRQSGAQSAPEICPSELSPLLYEAYFEDGSWQLISIDPDESKVVDYLAEKRFVPFYDSLMVSPDNLKLLMSHLAYTFTSEENVDTTFIVQTDSLYELSDSTGWAVLLYYQYTILHYALRNHRFALVEAESNISSCFEDSCFWQLVLSNVGREYNRRLLAFYDRLSSPEPLTYEEVMSVIPKTRDELQIYLPESLDASGYLGKERKRLFEAVDMAVTTECARSYGLMNQYLTAFCYADGALTDKLMPSLFRMDDQNPFLFREAARYIFQGEGQRWIAEAIEQEGDQWKETIEKQ